MPGSLALDNNQSKRKEAEFKQSHGEDIGNSKMIKKGTLWKAMITFILKGNDI